MLRARHPLRSEEQIEETRDAKSRTKEGLSYMELVQNPGSEDSRFSPYVECPEDDCIYILDGDALVQYPLRGDGSGHWDDTPCRIDWGTVEDGDVPRLRHAESLLKGMALVRNPQSEDQRFAIYVDSNVDGSVYTLENGALVQHPQLADADEWDGLPFWDDGIGAEVAWDCIEEEDVPRLREVEALLKAAHEG